MTSTTLTPGTRIGPYLVGDLLGLGGMGAVYRAHDTKLGRDVASKVLLPAVADDPERLARFQPCSRGAVSARDATTATAGADSCSRR